MFDIGFTELVLIGVVSLVVIGPERLPDVARTAGRWIGKLQRFVRGVRADISRELETGDLKKLIGDQREQIDELRKMVSSTKRELESSTRDIVHGAKKKLDEMEDATKRIERDAEAIADEAVARADVTADATTTPDATADATAPGAVSDAAAQGAATDATAPDAAPPLAADAGETPTDAVPDAPGVPPADRGSRAADGTGP